jgi:hypothetical protein
LNVQIFRQMACDCQEKSEIFSLKSYQHPSVQIPLQANDFDEWILTFNGLGIIWQIKRHAEGFHRSFIVF